MPNARERSQHGKTQPTTPAAGPSPDVEWMEVRRQIRTGQPVTIPAPVDKDARRKLQLAFQQAAYRLGYARNYRVKSVDGNLVGQPADQTIPPAEGTPKAQRSKEKTDARTREALQGKDKPATVTPVREPAEPKPTTATAIARVVKDEHGRWVVAGPDGQHSEPFPSRAAARIALTGQQA